MSKKHFVAMAQYIKTVKDGDKKRALVDMAIAMGRQFNPNFNEEIFLKACGAGDLTF